MNGTKETLQQTVDLTLQQTVDDGSYCDGNHIGGIKNMENIAIYAKDNEHLD